MTNGTFMTVWGLLSNIFDMLVTMMFFGSCMGKENIRFSKRTHYILTFVIYFAYVYVNNLGTYLNNAPAANAAVSAAVFLLISLLYRAKWLLRFFAVLSYLFFCMMSEVICYGLLEGWASDMSEYEILTAGANISTVLVFFIALTVSVIIKGNRGRLSIKDCLSFSITPVISIITLVMISIEDGVPRVSLTVCIAAVGLAVINLIIFFLLESVTEAAEIRERQGRMEQQFEFQERKYEQASLSFKSISGVIHDTNKHLIYLRECLDKGEYEEAKRYIDKAGERLESSYKRINTGYLPVDALVSSALNAAEAEGIVFKSDIKIEKERITAERYDLCVALGNLLDNAVEACRRVTDLQGRYISLSVVTADSSLVINIENSSPRKDGEDFKTDKTDRRLHGYGLGNVNAIAEKYGGVFTIERRAVSCEATLILPGLSEARDKM
ncbi:MAG: GHKL domain-containing protein [Ruminococcus sp.]|nr:GHKL domain-containing protein [Ruminococcus sp.]